MASSTVLIKKNQYTLDDLAIPDREDLVLVQLAALF